MLERVHRSRHHLHCVAVTTVLLASLLGSGFRPVREHVKFSAEQSFPLVRIVHSLSGRMAPAEKLVVSGRPTQFERQIKYYFRREHFDASRASEATAI